MVEMMGVRDRYGTCMILVISLLVAFKLFNKHSQSAGKLD